MGPRESTRRSYQEPAVSDLKHGQRQHVQRFEARFRLEEGMHCVLVIPHCCCWKGTESRQGSYARSSCDEPTECVPPLKQRTQAFTQVALPATAAHGLATVFQCKLSEVLSIGTSERARWRVAELTIVKGIV